MLLVAGILGGVSKARSGLMLWTRVGILGLDAKGGHANREPIGRLARSGLLREDLPGGGRDARGEPAGRSSIAVGRGLARRVRRLVPGPAGGYVRILLNQIFGR